MKPQINIMTPTFERDNKRFGALPFGFVATVKPAHQMGIPNGELIPIESSGEKIVTQIGDVKYD